MASDVRDLHLPRVSFSSQAVFEQNIINHKHIPFYEMQGLLTMHFDAD
jgi:hypothetical protein